MMKEKTREIIQPGILAVTVCCVVLACLVSFVASDHRDRHRGITAGFSPGAEPPEKTGQFGRELHGLLSSIGSDNVRGVRSRVDRNDMGEITVVWLFGEHISDKNIRAVSAIPSLQTLMLGCCTNEMNMLDSGSFGALRQTKALRELVFYGGVPELTEDMCEAIASLKQLEILSVEFCPIDAEGKKHLTGMKWLKKLELNKESD